MIVDTGFRVDDFGAEAVPVPAHPCHVCPRCLDCQAKLRTYCAARSHILQSGHKSWIAERSGNEHSCGCSFCTWCANIGGGNVMGFNSDEEDATDGTVPDLSKIAWTHTR